MWAAWQQLAAAVEAVPQPAGTWRRQLRALRGRPLAFALGSMSPAALDRAAYILSGAAAAVPRSTAAAVADVGGHLRLRATPGLGGDARLLPPFSVKQQLAPETLTLEQVGTRHTRGSALRQARPLDTFAAVCYSVPLVRKV
jgi:hypothetical protein